MHWPFARRCPCDPSLGVVAMGTVCIGKGTLWPPKGELTTRFSLPQPFLLTTRIIHEISHPLLPCACGYTIVMHVPQRFDFAVDVGGTHIRVALYPAGEIRPVAHRRIATQGSEPPHERLAALLRDLWPSQGTVRGIGVASPGPLDPYRGVILATPNIPQWRDFPLRAYLEERFGVPVVVDNDANAAAVAEWRYGAGRGHHHLLYLTISTGIGGGVIVADRLLRGAAGLAGELGHLTVLPDGPLCGCGQRGHLEALASGPAIARAAEAELDRGTPSSLADLPRPLTAAQVAQAAQAGDTLARAVFRRAAHFLGRAIADYLHIFNPTIVVLGGGVVQAGAVLLEPLEEALRQGVMTPAYLQNLTLTTAQLGDDVGLLGALALLRETLL